ncbi:TniB family NTP-binding protein [Sulfurimonas sp. HSL-3221]|uniref:TniB family NTP-binding protein n=1 Tax=Sulfurimonadaceae TaxID=2771471 RepID=UPI001E4DA1F2|nr:TniB family NTP-binding protein [Sulfurimonas sp. HSL-3221]UFS62735.1 TniB family NTP-binding protein [Sulfurimonas sp. HSL-3221]
MSIPYSHIHDDYKHLLDLDAERRIASLDEDVWINYPKSDSVIQLLNRIINMPKKPRMQGLLIIGEAAIGKTSIVNRFAQMHPDVTFEDEDRITHVQRPVIQAVMQNSDERELYIAILETFLTPFRKNDTRLKLKYQAISLMRACHVKMLILDEIHNLLRGTPVQQRSIMDVLKNLSNELMIPIVGVGVHEAALVLGSEPQLASRFDIARLPLWDMDKNFRALLVAFEKRLPLKKPSHIDRKEKATLIYQYCQGNLGDLHRLLVECSKSAIERGLEEITVDLIKENQWVMRSNKQRAREIPL